MARARNIKPKIMVNEQLADVDPFARLLFIYLWMLADREGRLEDRPKRIKAEALPYDHDVDVDVLLDDLQAAGVLVRYFAKGVACIQILTFLEHQSPHQNESPSVLPSVEEAEPVEATPGPVEGGFGSGTEGLAPRLEGLATKEKSTSPCISDSLIEDSLIEDSLVGPPRAKPKQARRTRLALDTIPDEWVAYCRERHPQHSPQREFEAFSDHHRAKGTTMLDWTAAWRTWLRNADRFSGNVGRKGGRETTAEHNDRAFDEWEAGMNDGRTIDA